MTETSPVKVADAHDLACGASRVLGPRETGHAVPIALFRDREGVFHALDDACPHVGASLAGGLVHDDAVVECPLHHGLWCLRSGEPVRYPARRPATTHRVEVRGGQVWLHVGVPAGVD